MTTRFGPLSGLRVVEFSGLGPAPHCGMLLADQGADVLRIARPHDPMIGINPVLERGRSTMTLDLRKASDHALALDALEIADVLIEGFRPGVMEKLGLGPDEIMQRNPRLVYGRMTGWGQTGPLAKVAGHDINFIAVSGALAAFGEPGRTATPPLNLVGDYGGGSLYLAFGIMAALFERQRSGKGQIVDAAIVDGTASLMALFAGLLPTSLIDMHRGRNLLGGGAHFYRCYRCADGGEIAIGALEPQFYAELLQRIGAPAELLADQADSSRWEERSHTLEALFLTKTRDEWCALLEGAEACAAPVLDLHEATQHPQLRARSTFEEIDGVWHPGVAPRLSRTPGRISVEGPDGMDLLTHWQASRP